MKKMITDSELEDWVMDGYPMTNKNLERIKIAKYVRDKIEQRIKEFVQQEAIEFSKWQRNNKYQYRTSEQLYSLFKMEQ